MTDKLGKRRLSAILAADVAGYTRLVEQDTDGTVAAWSTARDEIIEPALHEHGGRLVKLTGDGFLAEFSSVQDSVNCAVATQQRLAAQPLHFRMGIHLGDVVDDGKDVHGEGVNIAARIEALADPGGVCISAAVFDAVRNRVAFEFGDAGQHEVKHVSAPVHVWRWPAARTPTASVVHQPSSEPENVPPAVLIEPLRAAGDLSVAEDLCEDFVAELVRAFAHRRGVRVVAQAPKQGVVAYVLNGRCRVIEEQCRLQLTMSLAATGEHVWAERFDGRWKDWDRFIESVIAKVTGALRIQENAYAGAALAATPDSALDLPGLLSKAAFLFYRYDWKSTEVSQATMERAVQLAPDNAMAVAMLAWALGHMVPFGLERLSSETATRALSLADRAVGIDPSVDFAFHARAWLRLWIMKDHAGCIADATRALSTNPTYHKGTQDVGLAQVFGGLISEGLHNLEVVVAEVPSEPIVPLLLAVSSLGHLLMGAHERALELAVEGHERRPSLPIPALAYAAAVADDKQTIQSAGFRSIIERHGLTASTAQRLPFADAGHIQTLEARLQRAGLAS